MPEGPEIHRQADRIRAAIAGEVLEEVYFAFDHLRPWGDRLAGRTVEAVEARGKALLIRFGGGPWVYTHNQLYGRWYVKNAGGLPKTRRSLRLALHTEAKSALLYSASTIEVLDPDEIAAHPFLGALGPDPLDPEVRWIDLRRRLEEPAHRRRSLAALLLEQRFAAGLGNYLRSEILFEAGVDPRARPADLSRAERGRVARAILEITRRAYASGGITRPLAEAKRLKAAGWPRRAYRHCVFGRSGQPCPRCEAPIERLDLAGRRLYRCPSCQGE